MLAQFASLQKPWAVVPWSPAPGTLKATLTSLGCTQTLRGWGLVAGRGASSCLGPCPSPPPEHKGDLGELARDAGDTHARHSGR